MAKESGMADGKEADPAVPKSRSALLNEMVTDHRAGPFHQAELLYRQALVADPNNAETWQLLGLIAHQAGYHDKGAAHIHQALLLSPGNAAYLNSLGSIYQEKGDYEQAIPCFQEVIRLEPTHLLAHHSLGSALTHVGRHEEAIATFRLGLAQAPWQPAIHNSLGEVYQRLCRFPKAMTAYRLASLAEPSFGLAHHNYLHLTNLAPGWDTGTIFDEHRFWGLRAALRQPYRYPNSLDPERPLRIGYVSADFREHPLARFIEPVLRNHNHADSIVSLYAEVPVPDEVTRRLQGWSHNWRITAGQTPQEVARQIREDAIDILVDLTGHHAGNRLDVFAQQPAPVQVTYLGSPNTTGLPAIDYWLTDKVLHPPDEPVQAVERLFHLPEAFFCFEPPASAPPVSPLPALRRGRFTFGSNHHLQQLNDDVLALWARVLDAVPGSRLLFVDRACFPEVVAWLRSRFQTLDIAPERIEARQPLRLGEPDLDVYDEIDLILDTFPVTGHASTCEALWMGVPVVTLSGERTASRLSTAVLTPLGLTDLIAAAPEDYVAQAQRLANDLDGLAALRQGLRHRMERLCDGSTFTRQLEAAYRRIWRDWCATQSAESKAVSAPRPSIMARRENPQEAAPPRMTRLNPSRTIEIIVPVRPGDRDRFPVPDVPGRISTRIQECTDGNLSRLYRDAYLDSRADLVLFKHDDFCFRHWESFEAQAWDLLQHHPILGVAGTRAFAPQRLPWWRQTAQPGLMDGLNRGMVSHPLPAGLPTSGTANGYHQTLYGPPGPVAVLDGVLLAVLRRWEGNMPLFGQFTKEDVAAWWDDAFGRHFYDMAFTFNASLAFQEAKLGPACYAMVADVTHESVGTPDRAWQEAAMRFVSRYGGAKPVRV